MCFEDVSNICIRGLWEVKRQEGEVDELSSQQQQQQQVLRCAANDTLAAVTEWMQHPHTMRQDSDRSARETQSHSTRLPNLTLTFCVASSVLAEIEWIMIPFASSTEIKSAETLMFCMLDEAEYCCDVSTGCPSTVSVLPTRVRTRESAVIAKPTL